MDKTAVVAAVLLAAFIIDRLIASLMFVVDYRRRSELDDVESLAKQSESRRKLLYFFLSAILGMVALHFIDYSHVELAGIQSEMMKGMVLWLILVCGADRISEFIGAGSEAPPPASPKGEIRVTGTLQVGDGGAQALLKGASQP